MNEAVPDCLVSGYESLTDGLDIPDLDTATYWRPRFIVMPMQL